MDSINELIKKRKKLRKKFVFQVEMNHIKATVIEIQYKMNNFQTKICQNFDTILKSKKIFKSNYLHDNMLSQNYLFVYINAFYSHCAFYQNTKTSKYANRSIGTSAKLATEQMSVSLCLQPTRLPIHVHHMR